jgi:hypothetical protein
MCLMVHELHYCIDLSLGCLYACLCNIVVGGGMCHFGGMCISYMLGVCHVYITSFNSSLRIFHRSTFEDICSLHVDHPRCIPKHI